MAKRRNGRVMKKVQPAVLTLAFRTSPVSNGSITDYIDLSQVASLVNRRFYRQGINWAVSGMKILGSTDANITISKLPDTWVFSNAWEKSFRAWQRMNNEALEEAESVKPKFLDFKIFADAEHHSSGILANLLPEDAENNVASAGEWSTSKIHVPEGVGAAAATNEFEFVGVGASYPGAGASGLDAVSLIEGYAASRGLPDIADPNTPTDASDATGATPENWMSALFSEGTTQDSDVIEDMITENNIAPYPFENDGLNLDTMYPGGANQLPALQVHDLENITGTTIGGITRIKGGLFPCGLIKLGFSGLGPGTDGVRFGVQIDLVPGDHRGYLCSPMTEM